MIKVREEYIIDEKGKKKAIVISLSKWQQIKEELEELDDIKAYDEAKLNQSDIIPFNEALEEIQRGK